MNRKRFLSLLVFLPAMAAGACGVCTLSGCGDLVVPAADDGGSSPDDTTDDGAAPDDAGLDVAMEAARDAFVHDDADTLHLVTFTATPSSVTPGQSVTFSVVVSDDLGASNVASGQIVDEAGATYATLQMSGSNAFQVTLTYAQITNVRPVSASPAGTMRTFTAVFRNRQAHVASASTSVAFRCAPGDGGCGH